MTVEHGGLGEAGTRAGMDAASETASSSGGAAGSETPDIGSLAFDEALAELQRTVAELEAGGQPLEEAIRSYERGVELHERCARLLTDAELRVKRLVERAGGALEAIETADDGEAEQG